MGGGVLMADLGGTFSGGASDDFSADWVLSREGSWVTPASGCHQLCQRVGRYGLGLGL